MERKKKFIINTVYYLILAIFVYMGIKFAVPVLMPFIIAAVFATVINLIAGRLSDKLGFSKKLAAALITAAFFGLLAFLVVFAGSSLLSFIGEVIIRIPKLYREEILPLLDKAFQNLALNTVSMDAVIRSGLEENYNALTQNLGQYISEFSMKAVKIFSSYAAGFPSFVVKLIITVVATFFMSVDYDRITGFILQVLPDTGRNLYRKIKDHTVNIIFIYIKSYTLLWFMTFVELSIGLLVLRIPYAILIALAIAIFDILPVLGTGGILIPWALIAGVLGNYRMAVGIIILYLVVTVIRNTVEPRIVGKQIGIHALAALMAMFIGLKLFGIIGLIGLPVALSILVNLEKSGATHLFHIKASN